MPESLEVLFTLAQLLAGSVQGKRRALFPACPAGQPAVLTLPAGRLQRVSGCGERVGETALAGWLAETLREVSLCWVVPSPKNTVIVCGLSFSPARRRSLLPTRSPAGLGVVAVLWLRGFLGAPEPGAAVRGCRRPLQARIAGPAGKLKPIPTSLLLQPNVVEF